MSSPFLVAALSRQDGSEADGIHLLWTAPSAAGYSVEGFDIQRRVSSGRGERVCYTLTPEDLQRLHRDLRLETSLFFLGLRRTKCPEFPPEAPDEPAEEKVNSLFPTRQCVDFGTLSREAKSNPREEMGVKFRVHGAGGRPLKRSAVKSVGEVAGLDCGSRLLIDLPAPAQSVELLLAHFSEPPKVEAFDANEKRVAVKNVTKKSTAKSTRKGTRTDAPQTFKLTGKSITRVAVTAPRQETLLLSFCYDIRKRRRVEDETQLGAPSNFVRPDSLSLGLAAPTSFAAIAVPPATGEPMCVVYDADLRGSHQFASVTMDGPQMMSIALRDGKAVDTRFVQDASGTQHAVFENRAVDRLVMYVPRLASSVMICVDIPQPEVDERNWATVPFIAKGIHMPLVKVNGALASPADEESLAASRLLPGESFNGADFHRVTDTLNETAKNPPIASPVLFTTLTRERTEDPFVELRGWPYGMSLLTVAAWRRMLGFGYLDEGRGLKPGERYDYRVTGHFRRRDVHERLYGFHTVPVGTTLPASFHLGDLLFNSFMPSLVGIFTGPGATELRATGRKGIALRPRLGVGSLEISFPTPVKQVVLEFEPSADHSLSYSARTTDDLLGLSGSIFTDIVPRLPRVTLDFPEPVDKITLEGTAFLYGVRFVTAPPGGGPYSPDTVVNLSVVVHNVVYERTDPPPPPPFLGTLNLQQPVITGDPEVSTKTVPNSLGFRQLWIPPPAGGSAWPTPWPSDLGAFPPFDVIGFYLERRRVDTGEPFIELDGGKDPRLHVGSRSSRQDSIQLYPGVDLLRVYPEGAKVEPPIPIFMENEDVLVSMSKGGPPPGSLFQYRIFSVDAIGRPSATPTLGSTVQLRKHSPPPQPGGPVKEPPAGVIIPPGVRARVLQKSDPNLSADDKTLLAANTNAVVLEWGWTEQERQRDPFAKNFRVYWQPVPPDTVEGSLVGVASLVSGLYEMSANMNQPIQADALKGRYIRAGGDPFKVASNTAGQAITIRFEPSVLKPSAVPAAEDFETHPAFGGAQQRPSAWPERTAIVPITSAEDYRFIFANRLTLDAAHARARVWVGVSATDDQAYIPDEVPSGRPNGNQPGNESSIAAVPAQARYLGQPVFTVPPPLPNVPEKVADEVPGETVRVALNLPALLPTITIPAGHRIVLERLGADLLVQMVSARNDDKIGVTLPDGATTSYALGNPSDQAAFLAQIRTSTPGRIEGRFLMDLMLRLQTGFTAQLEKLWQPVLSAPAPFGRVTDTLPNKAERYIHRIRIVDAAGHTSAGAAIVPQFVRVPSLRSPAAPEIEMDNSQTNTLALKARVHDQFDMKWLLVFAHTEDATVPADDTILVKPELLRIPNRRDLYPTNGIRLRLHDGSLLVPTAFDLTTNGTVEAPDRVLLLPIVGGNDKRVSVWAAAMTRDGITSRFAGPRTAVTGPPPLAVPTLIVTAGTNEDHADWTALTVPAELAIERSLDGGTTWTRISPWLPETTNPRTFKIPSTGLGARKYRLVLRGSRDRRAAGTPVTVP